MYVPVRDQFQQIALLLTPAIVLLGVLVFISTRSDIAVANFTRDPLAIVDAPPYLVGDQGQEGDRAIPRGNHELKIRARDGDGWLERTFAIVSGG